MSVVVVTRNEDEKVLTQMMKNRNQMLKDVLQQVQWNRKLLLAVARSSYYNEQMGHSSLTKHISFELLYRNRVQQLRKTLHQKRYGKNS